jgi:hypothetical protein
MKKSIMFIQKSFFLLSVLCFVGSGVSAKLSLKQGGSKVDIVLGDDLKAVKIKGPSYNMFKKADLEMHYNMYNDIKAAYEIKFDNNEVFMADQEMNQLFYEENASFKQYVAYDNADSSINEQFYSEQ